VIDLKKAPDLSETSLNQMFEGGIGDIALWKQKVVIARFSTLILLFKFQYSEALERSVWTKFQVIQSKGFVSINKTINTFQIIEDKYIRFFKIEESGDEIEAVPINVMNNFMKCGNMIFGELQKFCITFKSN
jgi:hypothetical protein